MRLLTAAPEYCCTRAAWPRAAGRCYDHRHAMMIRCPTSRFHRSVRRRPEPWPRSASLDSNSSSIGARLSPWPSTDSVPGPSASSRKHSRLAASRCVRERLLLSRIGADAATPPRTRRDPRATTTVTPPNSVGSYTITTATGAAPRPQRTRIRSSTTSPRSRASLTDDAGVVRPIETAPERRLELGRRERVAGAHRRVRTIGVARAQRAQR